MIDVPIEYTQNSPLNVTLNDQMRSDSCLHLINLVLPLTSPGQLT